MFKKVALRALLGAPLGICISYVIAIVISLIFAGGWYSPCPPALIEQFGTEIAAVVFQTILSAILGAAFAGASVIWEIDSWSIAKQTGIHFLVSALAMFPIAWFANWMPHSLFGVLSYAITFVIIFVIIWVIMYLVMSRRIRQINDKLKS